MRAHQLPHQVSRPDGVPRVEYEIGRVADRPTEGEVEGIPNIVKTGRVAWHQRGLPNPVVESGHLGEGLAAP